MVGCVLMLLFFLFVALFARYESKLYKYAERSSPLYMWGVLVLGAIGILTILIF